MKIHLETHDLPISDGYSPADGHITVYCGRCAGDYAADRHWAERYMTRLRRDLDRELDRGYITSEPTAPPSRCTRRTSDEPASCATTASPRGAVRVPGVAPTGTRSVSYAITAGTGCRGSSPSAQMAH